MDVTLTPEQTEFAEQCVREGRYPTIDAVIQAGLKLLYARQAQRSTFTRMLDDAVEEAHRSGWIEWEEIEAELDEIIRQAAGEH